MIRSVDPVSQQDIPFAIEWALAASKNGTNDPSSSCLALTMEGMRRSTPAFDKWQKDMLDSTLRQ